LDQRAIDVLLAEASVALDDAHARLTERLHDAGCRDWADAQQRLAALHPTREEYLQRFTTCGRERRRWRSNRELLTWPDAPIRYVPIPAHTREAAPLLYYLFYRSPARFDQVPVHEYVVTPIDADLAADERERRLRAPMTASSRSTT
jgi:hypothetical protein